MSVSSVSTPNTLEKPNHYKLLKIQPVEYTMMNTYEFWRGNIIKYASRAGHKMYPAKNKVESEIIDLKKTIECCQIRIDYLNKTNRNTA